MPQFVMPISDHAKWNDFGLMERGYWEAAFFTNTGDPDDAENGLENACTGDIAPCAWEAVKADCAAFLEKVAKAGIDLAPFDMEQVGRDFWFTRNGHGVGFWDRPEIYGGHGDALSELCRHDEVYIYRGDDGLIYHD